MGKKEEEEIIRIAKKMDKMAQKKNGVRRMNVYLHSRGEANVCALTGCAAVYCRLLS